SSGDENRRPRAGRADALQRFSRSALSYRHHGGVARKRIRSEVGNQRRELTCPVPWEETPKAKVKARMARSANAETICSSARSSAALPPRVSSKSTIKTSTS